MTVIEYVLSLDRQSSLQDAAKCANGRNAKAATQRSDHRRTAALGRERRSQTAICALLFCGAEDGSEPIVFHLNHCQ